MGTSGNRKGFKAYSINTTVRNPIRNKEFLAELVEFEGTIFDEKQKNLYYRKLIRKGIYIFSSLNESILYKYRVGEELTDREVEDAIDRNPQKTKESGRVMTQVRTLRDQGLIKFNGTRNKYCIYLTKLGKALLDGSMIESDIYTKSMLGLLWGSVVRNTAFNHAHPFLNTLFVIDELEKRLKEDYHGITFYEFAVFILTMKDCNYQLVVDNILEYRKKYGSKSDLIYAQEYFDSLKLLPISIETFLEDYPDDVYRKFRLTGLISTRGNGYRIDINRHEIEKVEAILKEYRGYAWKNYSSVDAYYDYMDSLVLPWEKDTTILEKNANRKAAVVNYVRDVSLSLDDYIRIVDQLYYRLIFEETAYPYTEEQLFHELDILDLNLDDKESMFSYLGRPARLEWVTTLLLSMKFGKPCVFSNMSFDNEGNPSGTATGKRADIDVADSNHFYTVEVTMTKDLTQQLNTETNSVARHLVTDPRSKDKKVGTLFIAPYIHYDTIDYYQFKSERTGIPFIACSVSYFKKLYQSIKPNSLESFNDKLVSLRENICEMSIENYQDSVNPIAKKRA